MHDNKGLNNCETTRGVDWILKLSLDKEDELGFCILQFLHWDLYILFWLHVFSSDARMHIDVQSYNLMFFLHLPYEIPVAGLRFGLPESDVW